MELYDYADILTENNVTLSDEVSIIKSDMGDGYSYSAPSGLNHIKVKAVVKWTNLTVEKRDKLHAFFRERGGYKNFEVELPGDTKSRFFKCDDYSFNIMAVGYYTYTAVLNEDFALGPDA